jgi:hypothetical protein
LEPPTSDYGSAIEVEDIDGEVQELAEEQALAYSGDEME